MRTGWRPSVRQLAIVGATLLAAVLAAVLTRPGPAPAPHRGMPVEASPPVAVPSPPVVPPSAAPSADATAGDRTTPERRRPDQPARPAQPDRGPGRRPSSPPEPLEPQPPADTPVVVAGVEDLAREPLPDGVPEQVNFFFGGGPECFDRIPAPPPAIELSDDAIIPSPFRLCFFGFDKKRSLRITLTPPGGPAITRTLAATGDQEQAHMFRWPRLPSDRAGKHRITARQGRTEITRTITVLRPDRPRLWIDRPPVFQTSTDVHMYYAGFPPHRMIPFNVYAGPGYRATFRVPADALGGGHAILRTGDDLPDGCVGVSHPALGDSTGDQPPNTENGFCTSRPATDRS